MIEGRELRDAGAVRVGSGGRDRRRWTGRIAPAVGLFLLAPLVGEFLLGNLGIDHLYVLPLLAPLYGGGALLIRETVRRTGRGWPAIVVLAAAYALVEEGPVDQLLWNPTYGGPRYLAGDAFVPVLGTNLLVLQAALALHTVWSISVPIALVETFVPRRRTTPWLGRPGLAVTAVVFAVGVVGSFWGNHLETHFQAPAAQYAGGVAVIVALVVLAFAVPYRPRPVDRTAPSPWLVGALTLALTSGLLCLGMFWPGGLSQWPSVAGWCVVAAALAAPVARWSRFRGWGAAHRLGVAAGALLTYAWISFPHRPVGGGSGPGAEVLDLLGNTVTALLAVVLILLAARVVRRTAGPDGQDRLVGSPDRSSPSG